MVENLVTYRAKHNVASSAKLSNSAHTQQAGHKIEEHMIEEAIE